MVVLAGLAACRPRPPRIEYVGNVAVRPPIPPDSIEVFRTGPPREPIKDLGTVTVTCPSGAVAAYGEVRARGGCTYGRAIQLASTQASEAGADGIHSVETSVNSAGAVVSLRASVFYYLPRPRQPKAAAPVPPEADEEEDVSADERLRRLEKLKTDQLITPEEYAAKRAEILKDL